MKPIESRFDGHIFWLISHQMFLHKLFPMDFLLYPRTWCDDDSIHSTLNIDFACYRITVFVLLLNSNILRMHLLDLCEQINLNLGFLFVGRLFQSHNIYVIAIYFQNALNTPPKSHLNELIVFPMHFINLQRNIYSIRSNM